MAVRASPTSVGYQGDLAALTTLNIGDPAPAGTTWDGPVLRVNADSVTLDHYRINAGIDIYGADPTITNCIVTAGEGCLWGINSRAGTLTISDVTLLRDPPSIDTDVEVHAVAGYVVIATRCDISGGADGIYCGVGSEVRQCYIHGPALVSDMHVDGIQVWAGGAGTVLVEDSHIDVSSPDGSMTDGVHQNSAITIGDPAAGSTVPTVRNNYLAGGGFILRLEQNITSAVVVGNDFGPVDATGYGETAITESDPSSLATWHDNRRNDGSLIPHPGGVPPMAVETFHARIAAQPAQAAGEVPTRSQLDTEVAAAKLRENHTGTQPPTSIDGLEAYVDGRVQLIVDAAPGALDTLNELAAALDDDPNFAATVSTQIGDLDGRIDALESASGGGGYAETIGDGATSLYTVTHNLGSTDVLVSVQRLTDGQTVHVPTLAVSGSQVELNFGSFVPPADSHRVLVYRVA